MSLLKGLVARARSLFAPNASELRMEEEFQFHLTMETERLMSAGVSPDEARRRARVAFGGLDQYREAMRDGRGMRLLSDFGGDMRYGVRAMRRSPGFAIAVAITLGVGIGVNGIVFGYINSMLFRSMPVQNAHELVGVFTSDTRTGTPGLLSYDDYVDFRDRSGAFAGLAGESGVPLNLVAGTNASAADMIWGDMVTENFFSVLGMHPVIGRLFTAADAPQGGNPYVVLSYDSWQQRFHGDSSVVGRVVRVNGSEFTVTGVAPPGFKGLRTFGFWPEMFVPIGMHNVIMPGSTRLLEGRGPGWMYVVGRMRKDWTMQRTAGAATLFATQLARTYPATNASFGVTLLPGAGGFDHPGFVKPRVLVLASIMGLFASIMTLLIICANLANMQLARASARTHEIAVRLALGCSRTRLARQLLTEALVLAIPGMMLAILSVRLSPWLEQYLVPHLQFRVGFGSTADYHVALFTAAVAILAVLLFGLTPALRVTRRRIAPTPASVIGARGRNARPRGRMRGALVVTQLAMSVVLLVGGTLFVRSLFVARAMDLGFDASDRLLLSVNVGLQRYDSTRGSRFYNDVLTRTQALPGVIAAAWAFPVPFDTYGRGVRLYVPGARTNAQDGTVSTTGSIVSDDFIKALGLRLEAGRPLAVGDSAGAPNVVIVSRSLATHLWPGRDPIGQRARQGTASGRELLVIGVVSDASFLALGDRSPDRAYLPIRQNYTNWETLLVHTRAEPMLTLPRIRTIVASADPSLPLFGVMTMHESVESGFATSRMAASIAGFFAALALLIAAVGLYAVVAGSVTERTREIGVRLALGSTPSGVLRFIMSGGARLGAWGLAIGLVLGIAVAKLLGGLLYGLSPSDPVTFVIAPIVLASVVVVATYLPAHRAVKLDPIAALRSE
ncbi:MAG TPA: ABC transporter permease [Gemmatimonadaceae bacterium]|nr:ABC transporter permease [Gemmatimonadaceae bacterium]